jgi:predicted acyltransferase
MAASVSPAKDASPASQRLVSLDAFRGAVMAFMIMVNNNGREHDAYAQLRHSQWHGWTLTDTVFPSFVWIAGVAITLSLGKRLAAGVPRSHLLLIALRRAAILFVLGMAVYAFPHFNPSTQRILGVLQRIAICYLAASAIYLWCGVRGQITWLVALLAAYWLIMTLAPVPGFGRGRLDVEGNFAHYVDRLVLGPHNYAPTHDWDPEGIVSTLPAIATALFGLLAGRILQLRRSLEERTVWLFMIGALLVAVAWALSFEMPINKKLWTDTFCFFMAGLDFTACAILVWVVDGLGWKRPFRPAVILGMNAIAIYLASEFGAELVEGVQPRIYRTVFAPLASPANASLLYSLTFTAIMYLIAYFMYRKRWFIRV